MTLVLVPLRFSLSCTWVSIFLLCLSLFFFTLFLSAPFCVFWSYSLLASSERRAHLFIVLIYGNNFICRKAAGNIPRERERGEINFIEPSARYRKDAFVCFFFARAVVVSALPLEIAISWYLRLVRIYALGPAAAFILLICISRCGVIEFLRRPIFSSIGRILGWLKWHSNLIEWLGEICFFEG